MNKVILTGRLTAAPDLRQTPSGKFVTEFSVAVDRFTGDGEKTADFVQCVAWNKQAENLCKYQQKGSKIAVEGALRVDKYKDKEGKNRYKIYVLAANIEYLDSKKEQGIGKPAEDYPEDPEDDLPF